MTVYAAFLRGLFEADGTVQDGVPSLSTADEGFAAEVVDAQAGEVVCQQPSEQVLDRQVVHSLCVGRAVACFGFQLAIDEQIARGEADALEHLLRRERRPWQAKRIARVPFDRFAQGGDQVCAFSRQR